MNPSTAPTQRPAQTAANFVKNAIAWADEKSEIGEPRRKVVSSERSLLEKDADHYHVGLIWVPRLEGSSDDFVVLDCSCTWEEEHGMVLLIKNGSSVAWWGNAGPWQWESPADFLAKQNE